MKAVSDRIILIPEKSQGKIGGIIIPDSSVKKPAKGKVVSAGIDCKEVKEGYEILFLEGHGVLHQENDVQYLVIREQDVLGYWDETATI